MSLFGSIQLANNALRASQIGLQVVGQNIANANTPGYIREDVIYAPASTQRRGNILLGMGVRVEGVVQRLDGFLEERLRGATSDRASVEVQEETYLTLESLIAELGDSDLSTSLNRFLASVSEVLNQPESEAVRNLAVLQGETLTSELNRMATRVLKLRSDLNERVVQIGGDINTLTETIQKLNVQIAAVEGGDASKSDAVGLRDQRLIALEDLSKLIGIRVSEQESGGVSVTVGGEFLVFEGSRREVEVDESVSSGSLTLATIQISDSQTQLDTSGGELAGLIESRDAIIAGFLGDLDGFSSTLAFEFNKVFSSGQGLKGLTDVTSEFSVEDTNLTLDQAGLPFTPVNGSLDVLIYNRQTTLTQTIPMRIDLNGLDEDTTVDEFVAMLDAVEGIAASFTPTGNIHLSSDAENTEFGFANDTSGALAALGINAFFTGTTALELGVNSDLVDDPALFAASRGGVGEDSLNAVELAAFLDRPLDSANGDSIGNVYDRLVSATSQDSSVTRSVAEGFRVFEETLRGQKLAISGVSLDEEAVRMIMFQRSFQAAARYISTISELLEVLINL